MMIETSYIMFFLTFLDSNLFYAYYWKLDMCNLFYFLQLFPLILVYFLIICWRCSDHNWQKPVSISNPHHDLVVNSLAEVFGWDLSWRQTFWGNKWFGGNNFLTSKTVAQRDKWIGTLSTNRRCPLPRSRGPRWPFLLGVGAEKNGLQCAANNIAMRQQFQITVFSPTISWIAGIVNTVLLG